MKRSFLILLSALTISNVTFAQTKSSKDAKLEAHIIELENAGWNAFKTKDAAWFESNLTDEYLQITEEGVSNKTEVIQSLADCDVKSFSLYDFKLVKVSKCTILLVYTASQDGTCGDEKLPVKVQVSVNYVKHGGKWLEAFYMDAPIHE